MKGENMTDTLNTAKKETAAELWARFGEMKEDSADIIIIGAGTAGLSAAVYALRAGCSVIILENNVQGGQIITTDSVENYPGIKNISGFDFAQGLVAQAKGFGARLLRRQIAELLLEGEEKIIITNKEKIKAKAVIIATGASHRHLGCPGEDRLGARGVSYCATCDGALYREKDVMVVGGGNTALMDALFLANMCRKVYLVHRRDAFRGEQISAKAVEAAENIEILYNSVVDEFLGEDKLAAARIKNVQTAEMKDVAIDAVFIAVGLAPENVFLADQIALDESGYVIAGEDCRTNLEGVWVAGDTRTKELRQLITAAADGAVAGSGAAEYVVKNK